jgi:hypothetical protein
MIKEGNLIALLKLQQNHLVALQALEEVNLHRTSHMGQGRSQLPILLTTMELLGMAWRVPGLMWDFTGLGRKNLERDQL